MTTEADNPSRRTLLATMAVAPAVIALGASAAAKAEEARPRSIEERLSDIEFALSGKPTAADMTRLFSRA